MIILIIVIILTIIIILIVMMVAMSINDTRMYLDCGSDKSNNMNCYDYYDHDHQHCSAQTLESDLHALTGELGEVDRRLALLRLSLPPAYSRFNNIIIALLSHSKISS